MQHVTMTGASFIRDTSPGSTTKRRGQALLPLLVPFPIACFAGAFVTDLVYWRAPPVVWGTVSHLLVSPRPLRGGLAVVSGAAGLSLGQGDRAPRLPHPAGSPLAFFLSLLNAL